MPSHTPDERAPLLQNGNEPQERRLLEIGKEDDANPRAWSKRKKLANIAVIASMSILSPLASSIFAPGIEQIAKSLHASPNGVIGCQTGFVVMLGIGPLLLAPLSETFGRKTLYLICFAIFTLLQIPTALAKSLPALITLRTIAGFFGSVGIANGGGTISDMYEPSERADIFGWYLLGPLLGPTIGPLLGAIILNKLDWPWLFWILLVICAAAVLSAFFFLRETYVPAILSKRKKELEASESQKYYFEGEDLRPMRAKLAQSVKRPLLILFTQPIVITMALYQALLFSITYSLYTQFQSIYGGEYGFSTLQNYYIDAFEKYAASAIAAGSLFRSVIGGIVPVFTGGLLDQVGMGWGFSVFGFISIALAPSPVLFYMYGGRLRERFAIKLD
ncbi:membrane transporter [Diplocarpon rosae]|nr:membrane transporter [Diplocarpon rosae]